MSTEPTVEVEVVAPIERKVPMMRLVLDFASGAEQVIIDMLMAAGPKVLEATGIGLKVRGMQLIDESSSDATAAVDGKPKRKAAGGGGSNRVMYRLTTAGQNAQLKGRKYQVWRYIGTGAHTARQIWEGITQATGEANTQKAVESALHTLRTEGVVESVEMEAAEE